MPLAGELVRAGDIRRLVSTFTPNGTGYATITHGAGFTPSVVVATGNEPDSGTGIPAQLVIDDIGATTFRCRVLNASGSAVTTQVTVMFLMLE